MEHRATAGGMWFQSKTVKGNYTVLVLFSLGKRNKQKFTNANVPTFILLKFTLGFFFSFSERKCQKKYIKISLDFYIKVV